MEMKTMPWMHAHTQRQRSRGKTCAAKKKECEQKRLSIGFHSNRNRKAKNFLRKLRMKKWNRKWNWTNASVFSLLLRFSALLLLLLLIFFQMCFHLNVFACVPLNWFENDEANEQFVCCCWYALAIDRTNYSFKHSTQCAHTTDDKFNVPFIRRVLANRI